MNLDFSFLNPDSDNIKEGIDSSGVADGKEPDIPSVIESKTDENDPIVIQPKRRRGRPRKDEASSSSDSKKQPKGKSSKDEIQVALACIFAIVTSLRGPHWKVDGESLEFFSDSLANYLQTLPNNPAKKISSYILPITLLAGIFALFETPIKTEIELAKQNKEKRKASKNGLVINHQKEYNESQNENVGTNSVRSLFR
jgi:hypothetical protein